MTTETETATEKGVIAFTPESAIQMAIFDLCDRRYKIKDDPDKQHVVASYDRLIESLELAQWELGEYREIKAALAVLRNAMP